MASSSDIRLNHARHNKDVSKYLRDSEKNYTDWEVTTAFYSALHYITSFLFPGQYEVAGKSRHYLSFEDSYRANKQSGNSISKHRLLEKLVGATCPEVHTEYKTLFDTCMSARYSDYRIEKRIANLAHDSLYSIAELCEPV